MSEQIGKLHAIPIYKQIEQDLRNKVRQRHWIAGSRLPSRVKLAKEYGVGLPTLEQAIQPLLDDGTLQATPRGGTFVSGTALLFDAQSPEPAVPLDSLVTHRQAMFRLDIIAADIPWYTFLPEVETETSEADWASVLVRSLERTFSQLGGMTHFVQRYNNYGQMQISLRDALAQSVAQGARALALINVVNHWQVTEDLRSLPEGTSMPVVLLSWDDIVGPLPQVVYDHAYGGYMAAEHLLQAGYSPILFLDVLYDSWAKERLRGIQSFMQHLRLTSANFQAYNGGLLPDMQHLESEHSVDEQKKFGQLLGKSLLAGELFSAPRTCTPGIIAPTDTLAVEIYTALSEAGLLAGKDYGLVGFDDRQPARARGITSLRPPLEEIGQESARLLFRMLNGESTPYQIRLRSHLIVRSSTTRAHTRST